ncbi:hypothetical protein SH1V18_20420 [Vallitalea longa]|uniref:DUF2953 domain-containing protein n=1 Tax=Vallitalea longa TaxID=2936439 RepID=A0A9W5Y9W2_9FIRM|nr:DUF2953 domain-containing protein [Vallitalea longa]GKX29562.1 hypothetical protein SH1V18_20420 [Vallitalea longa]
MLAILLGILKVLLYIILFLILIMVLCILTVLFVPIRYRVEGEKYDAIKLDVRVSFLLHIFSFKYHMEDETNTSFKIFGKDILKKKKNKKAKKTHRKDRSPKKHAKDKNNEDVENNNENINYSANITDEETKCSIDIDQKVKKTINQEESKKDSDKIRAESQIEEEADNNTIENKIKSSDRVNSKSEKHNRKKSNKKNKMEQHKKEHKKQHKKDKSANGKKNIKQVLNTIKDFIKNEENRAVIKMIKDKILKMIKHILPKKFMAKMIIGTGDPASTGYVVGAVSILYTVTGNKLKVVPDFTEKIFQGCFYGKGKIYLIVLLKNTLSIILDKRVRKLYKAYKA